MKTQIAIGLLMIIGATSCSHNESTKPQRKDITDAVFASGNIFDDNEYLVIAPTDQFLKKSYVKEGDKVKEGMPLFLFSGEVQSAQYETAQANYLDAKAKNNDNSPQMVELKIKLSQANAQLATDESNVKRYENLVKTNAVSQVDYEKVKLQYQASKNNVAQIQQSLLDVKRTLALNEKNAANQLSIQKRNQNDNFITANFGGTVLTVYKNQGEYVRRGETIAKLGDAHPIIKLFIAEEDITVIKLNDKVVVSLNTDKQKTYNAKISKIYPAFDSKEQSFIVEASFDKVPDNVFNNTQLQANIIVAEKSQALVVPSSYIIDGNNLQLENGKIMQFVKGISTNEWVEVVTGIAENETIVLPNNKTVKENNVPSNNIQ
jgi:multidrug efflux pump subunit AcrA (membrane-fusion protein)